MMQSDPPTLRSGTLEAPLPIWPLHGRTPAFRLAIRRVYCVSRYYAEEMDSVLQRYQSGDAVCSGPYRFDIVAVPVVVHDKDCLGSTTSLSVLLEVKCSYGRKLSLSDLREVAQTAKAVLDEAASDLRYLTERIDQEFLDVRLPRRLREPIYQRVWRDALTTRSSKGIDFKTAEFSKDRLKFGPENIGAIDSAIAYLNSVSSAKTPHAVLDSHPYKWTRLIPIAMGVALVLTWLVPLSLAWTVGFYMLFVVLMLGALAPVFRREIRLPDILRRTRATSAVFFFVLGTFGTLYALAELWQPNALGDDVPRRLGTPYIAATGITFTVGILTGSLRGIALVIAHIQMLVFMTTLVAAVVAILNIRPGQTPDEY